MHKNYKVMRGGGIESSYSNSTLLNLAKVRHFTFIKDPYHFEEKQNLLFYRGAIYQAHRTEFFKQYFNHHLCDLGHTGSKSIYQQWQKPKVSIAKHLPYKFLLSLEGNDVASNLKWVMSSNSLCIMPKPKFETWFMEDTLLPNVHYVQIAPNYADLEEKLEYFIAHPNEAKEIIANAHQYIEQFLNPQRESIISLLVLEKYFYYTGQTETLRI
ncbi:glycosyltransferase family 90 protein [Helicobacter sp. MIT 05-5293]|uniref:glycosyltransferase family 90 protein n=1 Tax=Helicobacter sp. MIT 05-5293 TaxID=1548149 RepID=UPI001F546EA0|nr:glycosyltransferase family 90 protein [Helicobacter sp. MIT 05-5293]